MFEKNDQRRLVDLVFEKKNPKTPPLVEVLWYDASDIGVGWFDVEDIEKSGPSPSLTVGYLVHKDNDCVKVISMLNHDHAGNGVMIPMGMVKTINYLSRKRL